jgi:uncharacterized protein (TIGR00255 family)
MIRSMTGFGRREQTWGTQTIAVELKAVNQRFLEVVSRIPKSLAVFEDEYKRIVQSKCTRGRIELLVSVVGHGEGSKEVQLDQALAKQYYRAFDALKREFKLSGPVELASLMGMRDLVSVVETPIDAPRLHARVLKLVQGAVVDLDAMRRREGQALLRDLTHRLALIKTQMGLVRRQAPIVVEAHYLKMRQRVEILLQGAQVDEARLRQELALFADRSDITEELTRLESHCSQFADSLKLTDSVGKTLDFLLQEMGREVNTIGSKANDVVISHAVVTMKGELEKIREQVQNLE